MAAAGTSGRLQQAAGGLGLIYVATFAIVLALVLIPIGALIYGSFRTEAPGMGGDWTLANWAGLFSPGRARLADHDDRDRRSYPACSAS